MEGLIFSLAIIIILGIASVKFLNKVRVPAFLGFLILGILLGPYYLNFINTTFLDLNQEICNLAIIILLIRAGLGLNRDQIRKVGRPAVEMSCLPSIIEGISIMFISHYLLGISFIEGGMLGFILASVSPAVLVPRMLSFMRKGLGTNKAIPTLLLAGSAADDVVAITIFSAFLGMYTSGQVDIIGSILGIPLSIIIGMIVGALSGLGILFLFKKVDFTSTEKLLIVLAISIVLSFSEDLINNIIPIAGLVGVMVLGFLIVDRSPKIGFELSDRFSNIWFLAEIVVFVLLGSQLDIGLAVSAIGPGLLIICLGLCFRATGVFISLLGTKLSFKEKVFCMIAYVPKANAQATIGSIPLAMGVASGQLILAITGIAILFTAPLGAILIEFFGPKLLSLDKPPEHLPITVH